MSRKRGALEITSRNWSTSETATDASAAAVATTASASASAPAVRAASSVVIDLTVDEENSAMETDAIPEKDIIVMETQLAPVPVPALAAAAAVKEEPAPAAAAVKEEPELRPSQEATQPYPEMSPIQNAQEPYESGSSPSSPELPHSSPKEATAAAGAPAEDEPSSSEDLEDEFTDDEEPLDEEKLKADADAIMRQFAKITKAVIPLGSSPSSGSGSVPPSGTVALAAAPACAPAAALGRACAPAAKKRAISGVAEGSRVAAACVPEEQSVIVFIGGNYVAKMEIIEKWVGKSIFVEKIWLPSKLNIMFTHADIDGFTFGPLVGSDSKFADSKSLNSATLFSPLIIHEIRFAEFIEKKKTEFTPRAVWQIKTRFAEAKDDSGKIPHFLYLGPSVNEYTLSELLGNIHCDSAVWCESYDCVFCSNQMVYNTGRMLIRCRPDLYRRISVYLKGPTENIAETQVCYCL